MSETQKPKHKKKASRPAWRRILCALLITLAVIVLLASAAIGGIVWMLTPERLTTLVTDTANGYLNAEFKASRIELTWWSTWPQLSIEIDSMEIVSHSLDNLPADLQTQLPADADTLLRIDHVNGTINLTALLDMNVELRDVKIVRPWINLVTADSLHANYLITDPSAPDDSSAVIIPPLSINRFEIEGPGQIHYASLTDSTDISLTIHNIGLNSVHNPVYTVTTSGIMNASLASILPSLSLPLSVDGRVAWDSSNPFVVSLNDMTIISGAVSLSADITVDAESDPTINAMKIRLNPVPVDSLLNIIPAPYSHMTQGISCSGILSTDISLRSPYNMVTDSLPDADINIVLTPGQVKYDRIRLRNFEAEADITLHNTGLDATVINIRKLRAYGPVIDARISARLQNIISNPYINGDFNGMLNLTRLSSLISKRGHANGLTIEGMLHGNARYRLRTSDLNPRNFYRTRLSGNVKLSDFCAYDSTSRAEVGEMLLKFGTSTSFTGRNGRIDSLLTVSMAFDTAAITTPDLTLSLSDVKAGIGAENRKTSTDTSTITPIGALMHIGRVDYKSSVDSSRILLRTIDGRTMLRQFAQATGRVPEIGLDISTSLAIFLDRNMRVAMRDGHFDLMAHLNDRTQVLGPRAKARYDSLC
ncbi:MAG: hypothetical protein K2M76_04935, partial [Muribaculaceae bacterium]|nr:hypothetical protein [Muribaculaceae bacterium]